MLHVLIKLEKNMNKLPDPSGLRNNGEMRVCCMCGEDIYISELAMDMDDMECPYCDNTIEVHECKSSTYNG